MALSNFERMLQLADSVFATRKDPNQLDVDDKVIKRLQSIHPATMSEFNDSNGPVAWVLSIPTTTNLMIQFLQKDISEKELYEQTPLKGPYEAIYLCSALVLEEYRNKGIAKQLTIDAIESIKKDHPIKVLFVWAFSKAGESLAENVAIQTGLALKKR